MIPNLRRAKPEDEIVAVSFFDRQGAVTMSAEMENTSPDHVSDFGVADLKELEEARVKAP